MWHVSSSSSVATLRTAIHLLLPYLLTRGLEYGPPGFEPPQPHSKTLNYSKTVIVGNTGNYCMFTVDAHCIQGNPVNLILHIEDAIIS